MRSVFVFSLGFLASISSATTNPESKHDLVKRQDGANSASTGTTVVLTTTNTESSSGSSSATSAASSSASNSQSNTITDSSVTSTSAQSTRALTTAKTIAQNAPAGGISMISPAPATTTYFPIGTPITFIWNYTSLLAPPSAINILISNTASTYTLTQNASVAPTGTFIWDTEQYSGQQNALINAFYTFAVFDAASAYTAVPKPGHLGANGFNPSFGVYATQTVSIDNVYECVTCSAAMSDAERQTMKFLLSMLGVTLLSFTYFSNEFFGGW